MPWRKKLCIKIHLVDRLFSQIITLLKLFRACCIFMIIPPFSPEWWCPSGWNWIEATHTIYFYDYFSLFTSNNKSLYLKPLRRLWFCWHIWSFSVRPLMSLLNAGYYSSSHTAFPPFCSAFLFIIALIIQIWMAEKFCSPLTMRHFQLGSAPIQRHRARDSARMVTGKWTSHSKIDFCEMWAMTLKKVENKLIKNKREFRHRFHFIFQRIFAFFFPVSIIVVTFNSETVKWNCIHRIVYPFQNVSENEHNTAFLCSLKIISPYYGK